jgi:hypothetical protein
MCYSCGCKDPVKDHGDPKHITEKTFEDAAKAAGCTVKEAKQNTLDLLKKNPQAK